jgi:cytochrome d ubiquinol oxidase subunit I
MEFDPAQMRNVMSNFADVVFSPVAVNKFLHAVSSGWTLGGVFVVGVSTWLLWRKNNTEMAKSSIKVGGWVGLIGILMTLWTGDGSAVQVSKVQPMKLAAMEGLYEGSVGQDLVGLGYLVPDKKPLDGKESVNSLIDIPAGLSILANHDINSFVPGIDDLILGREITPDGDTIQTVSYAERIEIGKKAHQALRDYQSAFKAGDDALMAKAAQTLKENYKYFGYGYFENPAQAVPPVAITFYAFRIMVMAGGYLLLFFVVALFLVYRKQEWLNKTIVHWIGILTIPVVYVCSQSGWIVAEVGRQPWVIQDILPTQAAISSISTATVQITFWMFAILFTIMLVAEISIMLHQIAKASKRNIEESTH